MLFLWSIFVVFSFLHAELSTTLLSVIHIQNRNVMLQWTVQMRMTEKRTQNVRLHANRVRRNIAYVLVQMRFVSVQFVFVCVLFM